MGIAGAYGLKGFKAGLQNRLFPLRAPSLSSLGCVLYVPLNSLPNGIASDLSGYGNNGINHGASLVNIGESYPLRWKNKLIKIGGQALSFDGVDDYVDCGNKPSLNITDAITIEVWVYRNDYDDWQGIATRNYRFPYGLNLDDIGRLESSFTFETIGGFYGYGNVVPKLQWVHVVSTWSKSTGQIIQYQNGVPKIVGTGYTNSIDLTTTYSLSIGQRYQNGQSFNGTIDEVRIYNRALSAREIAEHYRILKPLFN